MARIQSDHRAITRLDAPVKVLAEEVVVEFEEE